MFRITEIAASRSEEPFFEDYATITDVLESEGVASSAFFFSAVYGQNGASSHALVELSSYFLTESLAALADIYLVWAVALEGDATQQCCDAAKEVCPAAEPRDEYFFGILKGHVDEAGMVHYLKNHVRVSFSAEEVGDLEQRLNGKPTPASSRAHP